jgi:hypothetical protein
MKGGEVAEGRGAERKDVKGKKKKVEGRTGGGNGKNRSTMRHRLEATTLLLLLSLSKI